MFLALKLPGALFSKLQKKSNFKVSKKYIEVCKCIHYDLANFQYEIPCCVGSRKKTNWIDIEKKKQVTLFMLQIWIFVIFAEDRIRYFIL
jgi:hypothetical protein